MSLAALSQSWLDPGLALLYPPICQFCRAERAEPHEGYVCRNCQTRIQAVKPPYCEICGLPYGGEITNTFRCENCHGLKLEFDAARGAGLFSGLLREILHSYKYQRARWFEPLLVRLMEPVAREIAYQNQCSVLVPVPLHTSRLREREFNQAEALAFGLGKLLNLPVRKDLLERKAATRTQTLLKPDERFANVRRAFGFAAEEDLAEERVMLIDDVLTTGATTSACAGVLRAHGALSIHVCTAARGGI